MTDKEVSVVLPVFDDREFTTKFQKEVGKLSSELRITTANWIQNQDERVSPHSIGAAFVAALWVLSESLEPNRQAAMRQAFAMTLLSNDKNMQLAFAPVSPFPN